MVALGAAVGLHVLLFVAVESSKIPVLLVADPIIQLDLLQQPSRLSHAPSTPLPKAQVTTAARIMAIQAKAPQVAASDTPQPEHIQLAEPISDPLMPIPKQATAPPAKPQPSPASSSASNQAIARSIPQHVRHQMLSHVRYPRQARRHAWQGRAELQLHVYQQNIDTVTLLQSTGYPILDRAAQHGIASITDIPLANGVYVMPVEFRLQ